MSVFYYYILLALGKNCVHKNAQYVILYCIIYHIIFYITPECNVALGGIFIPLRLIPIFAWTLIWISLTPAMLLFNIAPRWQIKFWKRINFKWVKWQNNTTKRSILHLFSTFIHPSVRSQNPRKTSTVESYCLL